MPATINSRASMHNTEKLCQVPNTYWGVDAPQTVFYMTPVLDILVYQNEHFMEPTGSLDLARFTPASANVYETNCFMWFVTVLHLITAAAHKQYKSFINTCSNKSFRFTIC